MIVNFGLHVSACGVYSRTNGDLGSLARTIDALGNETKQVTDKAAFLDAAVVAMNEAAAALDKERAKALAANDAAKVAALDARKPANFAAFGEKAATLATTAQSYVDAAYQVDAMTGQSPLIVAAQLRALRALSGSSASFDGERMH